MGATCERASCGDLGVIFDGKNMVLNTSSIQCSVGGSILPNDTLPFTVDPNQVAGSSLVTYNLRGSQDNATQLDSYSGRNVNNPFGMAQFMQWTGVASTQLGSFLDAPNKNLTWFVGGCNISVYDVKLSYTNGTYSLVNRTLSAGNTTSMLFLPFVGDYFLTSFGPRMIINLAGQLDNTESDFLVEIARQVSQLGIGLNAGLFVPAQTMSDVTMKNSFLVSRYPINALSLLWASVIFYLILGVGLLARAANEQGDTLLIEPVTKPSTSDTNTHSVSMTSTLALAQQWVTNPSTIVAEYLTLSTSTRKQSDVLAPALSIQKHAIKVFEDIDETYTDRLGIGIHCGPSLRVSEGLRRRDFGVGLVMCQAGPQALSPLSPAHSSSSLA
jgi:hypothetical protein